MNWNRKDKDPKETIRTIIDILEDNQIETKISSENEFKNLWFSNRIEFVGLNGKGTNGKGITYEYALASGYAEFMERLQTRMLFEGLFPRKYANKYVEELEEKMLCTTYLEIFGRYLKRNRLLDVSKIEQIIGCKGKQYNILKKYYDYTEKKITYLPERFIFTICGSNGLCSGNTKYEAFCQGLCEVFERYVNYKIYFENKIILPTIKREVYEKLNSYVMICALEKKGYSVYIKDCTLGGMLPVLGVLIVNHNKTKYCFRLGSDINVDICIQRCITEMFQGLDINSTFRLQMNDLDDCDYENFWRLCNLKQEYYKTVRTGDGKIPRSVFLNPPSINNALKPFVNERLDNEQVAKKLTEIAHKYDMHIYIKDYSYLGFNTLGIFVPGFSEIIDYDYGIVELQNTFDEIRKMIWDEDIDILQLNILLGRIVSENLISADYTVSELLGLNLDRSYQGLLTWNIYLLIAWLNVILKNAEECEKWLHKYHNTIKINKHEARIETIIFQAIISDVSLNVLLEYMDAIVTEKEKLIVIEKAKALYCLYENGLQLNVCNECNECKLYSCCNYPFFIKLRTNLNNKCMGYEQMYNYEDEFYNSEV